MDLFAVPKSLKRKANSSCQLTLSNVMTLCVFRSICLREFSCLRHTLDKSKENH